MPLPLPNLDDRRWIDLVDEGRALIPRYARQWTDHNISDPGVTLVELFAWMTESSLYALNRTTPAHRQKFLALLGFAPHPPQPARTMLMLKPPTGTPAFVLPEGLEFTTKSAAGTIVPLRTERSITVSDVTLRAIQVDHGKGLQDRSGEWRNGLPVRAFGDDPQAGAAIYFGFQPTAATTPVSFALRWERPGQDAVARAAQSVEERTRLIDERIARTRACRRPLPDIDCPGAPVLLDPARVTPPHHSARIVWEVFTGAWTALAPVEPPATPSPGEVADDTRSLTLDGLVELNLPAGIVIEAQGAVTTPLAYVRCRLASGAYDAPPTLLDIVANAVPAVQSVPLSQRFTIPAGVSPSGTGPGVPTPGVTTRFRMNAEPAGVVSTLAFDPTAAGLPDVLVLGYDKPVSAAGHLTVEMARAGRGDGLPNQELLLPARAIVSDGDVRIYSHDGTNWQQWKIRPAFHASHRTDWHCVLNPSRGVLTFGDGERGRVLALGHAVFVTARVTTGAAAVLQAQSPAQIRESAKNDLLLKGFVIPSNVLGEMTTLAWPAAGGEDQETIAHASGRAAEVLHAHERLVDLAQQSKTNTLDQIDRVEVRALRTPTKAVSVLDLERMALDVPGTRVARARAWPGVLARFSCLSAPGAITLVVIPDLPIPQPQPSAGLLRALKKYLHRRRMVTTMLDVVGPTYLAVSVRATVRLRRGAGPAEASSRIEQALNAFLNPLHGGPDGRGWPFGRPVYRAEILQLIDGVPGVDHVVDLELSARGNSPQCGNLTLCPTWLAAAATHAIRIE